MSRNTGWLYVPSPHLICKFNGASVGTCVFGTNDIPEWAYALNKHSQLTIGQLCTADDSSTKFRQLIDLYSLCGVECFAFHVSQRHTRYRGHTMLLTRGGAYEYNASLTLSLRDIARSMSSRPCLLATSTPNVYLYFGCVW